ncbi:N-acetylmuramoyl-L-alanine amidase [Antarcticirhabdus aurantiaca]|uniref:N-acetylmuramoyl-L-alanine amidase n=1 Tax=Antarcticirhabdus aurantiaca TaxID=2606717 RepID=A0ACD4NXE8_9HYPH|nr:N-acetylmuramoyl-L-alanine amidase [Antarcticirhabdus aurantiaca]WAJ31451.1 N-acetylmuramoyl-L-alanine amidase [Jeongeuplla avenae]
MLRWLLAVLALTATALSPASATSVVEAIEQTSSAEALRWVLDLDAAADARLIALTGPNRIVLDLTDTVTAVALPAPEGGLVTAIKHGLAGEDRYRIIFTLARPVAASVQAVALPAGPGLELELRASGAKTSSIVGGPATVASASAAREAETPRTARHVIVVDAGHGGEDEGAEGAAGTMEKDVNLAFAKALSAELESHDDIDVVLTREDDTFIPLSERAAVARKAEADLFISIHADSIRYPELRGATVYTLSARASDELSRQVADSENAADRFADPRFAEAPEIVDILVDLTRRETIGFSEHFATDLVRRLGEANVRLIKNPKRSAGFRVLTAPDVPSVLVELGYLSNKEDEKLLKSDAWRRETARIMGAAVADYIKGRTRPTNRS